MGSWERRVAGWLKMSDIRSQYLVYKFVQQQEWDSSGIHYRGELFEDILAIELLNNDTNVMVQILSTFKLSLPFTARVAWGSILCIAYRVCLCTCLLEPPS